MWLVLCTDDDVSTLWAASGLAARGLKPLVVVTDSMLVAAPRWEHRVAESGESHTLLTLADGRVLDSRQVRGTLNRVSYVSPGWTARAVAADRDYAAAELFAFFMSWLHALPAPMVNSPTPAFLAGPFFSSAVWVARAARAGLQVAAYREESRSGQSGLHTTTYAGARLPSPSYGRLTGYGSAAHTLFVVGSAIVTPSGAPPPDAVAAGCRRLAADTGAMLLGVDFMIGPAGQWIFAGANAQPDLRPGGAALLDALAAVLRPPRHDSGRTEGGR